MDFCRDFGLNENFLSEFDETMLLDFAYIAEEKSEWKVLEKISSRVIELAPENEHGWFMKGQATYNLNPNGKDALVYYDKVITIGGDLVTNGLIGKAMIYSDQLDFQNALLCCDKALEISNDSKILDFKNTLLLYMKQTTESSSKQSSEKNIEELMEKGMALEKQGLWNKSLECYDEIIKINPGSIQAWTRKVNILSKQGKQKEVFEIFRMLMSESDLNKPIPKNKIPDEKGTSEWINDE